MYKYLGLPTLENLYDLSKVINLSQYTLLKISRKSELYYKKVIIPKKDGTPRTLACPSSNLKAIQAWILRSILDKLSPHKSATAYLKNTSIRKTADKHKGNKFILCLDIENFFPSTKGSKVYYFFNKLGYSKQISTILTNLCLFEGGLPQGGVTSPSLSNLVNLEMDEKISDYCNRLNLTYTRYADDIVISSNNPHKLTNALNFVKEVLISEGYTINQKKTRFLYPGKKRKIVGLIYGDKEEIGIGKKIKKKLRAKIHYLETKATKDEYDEKRAHINGWLAYLKEVDLKGYNQLRQYWSKVSIMSNISEVAIIKEI